MRLVEVSGVTREAIVLFFWVLRSEQAVGILSGPCAPITNKETQGKQDEKLQRGNSDTEVDFLSVWQIGKAAVQFGRPYLLSFWALPCLARASHAKK